MTVTRHATLSPADTRLPLVAICLGYFMVILDVTVVTVAVPAVGAALHSGVSGLQWVVDGYTLAFAGLLLFCGGLADWLGGRTVFLAGLAVFTLASAGCGAAVTVGGLIGARLVQGVGAAMMVPASLSLLQDIYTEPGARARAFGIWGMVSGVAAGAGPVLGGVLVASLGWRAVFFVNVPVGVAALLMTVRYVRVRRGGAERGQRGLDVPAQAAGALGLVGLATSLNEAATGWGRPVVLVGFVVFVLGTVAFVMLERRSPAPMLPLSLFKDGEFSASAVIGVLLNVGFYGLLFLAPLYFHNVHHYGPLKIGLALLPAMGVVAASSAFSGKVTALVGPRPPMVIGLLVGAAGLLGWLTAAENASYSVLIVPMAAAGFGTAFTMPASTAAIMRSAPASNGGAASAVFNTARQVGSAIGVALFGTFAAGGLVSGLHAGAVLGATGFVLAAALAGLFVHRS